MYLLPFSEKKNIIASKLTIKEMLRMHDKNIFHTSPLLNNLPDLSMNTVISYTLLSLYRKVNDVYLTSANRVVVIAETLKVGENVFYRPHYYSFKDIALIL